MKKGFGRTCMNKLYPSVPQTSLEGYELGSTADCSDVGGSCSVQFWASLGPPRSMRMMKNV